MTGLGNIDDVYNHYLKVIDENQQLKKLIHSLKCCLTSENIEPQIRVEKSLAKIKEFLTDGK